MSTFGEALTECLAAYVGDLLKKMILEGEEMEKTEDKNITIFRTYVSQDARIPAKEMQARMEGIGLTPIIKTRGAKDAFRVAVRDIFRQRSTFRTEEGTRCQILVSEAKKAEEDVRMEVHVRAEGEKIKYSDQLCILTLTNSNVTYQESPAAPGVFRKLGIAPIKAETILGTGQSMMYDSDLRRLMDQVLPSAGFSGWQGTHLAYGSEALEKLRRVQGTFKNLPRGSVRVSALTLENTPQNLSQISGDLADAFNDKLQNLIEKLQDVAPNLDKVEKELNNILTTHKVMEGEMGQALDIEHLASICAVMLQMKKAEEDSE